MVSLPGGGAAAPKCLAGGCVLEIPAGVFTVDGSGRLRSCPEVLPAARTEPGECSLLSRISLDPRGALSPVIFIH